MARLAEDENHTQQTAIRRKVDFGNDVALSVGRRGTHVRTMAKQHYLPAAFLAGFSEDETTLPRRRRRLIQGDKKTLTCCTVPAARVASLHDIYTLQKDPENHPDPIDKSWKGYESKLLKCINELTIGTVGALYWAGVLVPFVASLFRQGR